MEINVEIYGKIHFWFVVAYGDYARESCKFSQIRYLKNVRPASDIGFHSCGFCVMNSAGVRSADESRIADLFD